MRQRERVVIGGATLFIGNCLAGGETPSEIRAVVGAPPYDRLRQTKRTGRNHWNEGTSYGFKMVEDDRPVDPAHWLGFDKCVLFEGNHFGSRLPDCEPSAPP